ncbi:uncharacterized protein LOC131471807 [Solea solea]|uniref:uncharacterized protein LOC131471807 n=1 Tax=Solea solea TaxID=90069 RepID=UPI00272B9987|nr:uncharacterized protein LOC131471807 [Solea solea]XP_058504562.1 uncharacterized protein LOC131471807 [Solea solea]
MRPSVSVTLEPGLEQGVPWGRDLYTFVTSAAGHMMRTLQKPRKNRPSKRQVNHRRFLHNMIQRKFADIEAANHRLASALYFKDEEKTLTSQQSQEEAAAGPLQTGLLQEPEKCSVHVVAGDISESTTDASIDSQQTEVGEENHPDSPDLQKQPLKSQPNSSTSKTVNQANKRKKEESGKHKLDESPSVSSPEGTDYYHRADDFHTDYYTDESPLESINNLPDNTQTALQNSSFVQSPACSPELSPLSLDSCDFSIQMFTDISTCTQSQKSIIDIAESPWADIMDLFSIGNKDIGGSLDVGAFQSICACQDDVGQEVSVENQSDGFTQRMCSNTSEMEDLHYQSCEYRHSCQEDHESTQFNHFRLSQDSDVTQNQLNMPISCHYNMSHLPTYQQHEQLIHCMQVNCENNPHLTPFEGVAQSFCAPPSKPDHRPIPTPPHEDDWLFPDILKERTSPDC